jgi:hypothetical protein
MMLLVCLAVKSYPQKTYEIVIDNDSTEIGYCTFEDDEGYFVSVGEVSNKDFEIVGFKTNGIVVKFSDTTDMLFKTFVKVDTSVVFQHGFQKANGNYIVIGRLSDTITPEYSEFVYLCELTPDLEMVWERIHPAPEGYPLYLTDFVIDGDNNIVLCTSMENWPYTNSYLFLAKFDMDGGLLCSNFLPDFNVRKYNDFILKPDGTGYYAIGGLTQGSGFTRNWLDIDTELNIVATGGPLENMLQHTVTAKWLLNGNLFIVDGESQETPGAYRDIQVRIVSPDFENTMADTVFFDPDNVYAPVYDGMDFVYEDLIWTCTFNEAAPFFEGNEIFKVYLFDSEMELKGMKVYGGDSRWWFFHLTATTDGGCIITGTKREAGATTISEADYYLIKVMPEDIITSASETAFENDFDVAVFPNPFTNHLTTETTRENLVFTVFDNKGRKVLGGNIGNVPKTNFYAGGLTPGFYFYAITEKGRTIQSGKLVKQ